MAIDNKDTTTVAVIGCGPCGMFFLHAIETQRREMEGSGDTDGLSRLPSVTVYERSASPGGVWRAERKFAHGEEKKHGEDPPAVSTNMYEALWTNGTKENTEFFDYTLDEHFGRRLPVHMPRRAMLDYMLTRVTRHCPDLFEKYVRFNTTVVHVIYVDNKFKVTSRNSITGDETVEYFDKCIWAAGDNGKPVMPPKLLNMFRQGKFQGSMVHSSDSADLKQNVEGKRVLMIGGSYSSEDLALMAIKLKVDHVYISFRDTGAHVTSTTSWPGKKVTLLPGLTPKKVSGCSVELAKATYQYDTHEYKTEAETEQILHDIDTVIFCTGYSENMKMLDKALHPPKAPGPDDDFTVPDDWRTMENELSKELGHIPPGPLVFHEDCSYVRPGVYRGVLMSNPNMMFARPNLEAEEPLMTCDAYAWAFLALITGKTPLPSREEMKRLNHKDWVREMSDHETRYYLDANYRQVIDALPADHWLRDSDSEKYQEMEWEDWKYPWLLLARTLKDGHHPLDMGSYEEETMTEVAEKMYLMNWTDGELRYCPDVKDDSEYEWRTFRDYPLEVAEQFASVFTGTKAVPLKKRWLNIDENNSDDEW